MTNFPKRCTDYNYYYSIPAQCQLEGISDLVPIISKKCARLKNEVPWKRSEVSANYKQIGTFAGGGAGAGA